MNSAHADAFRVIDFAVDLFEHLCYIKCHRVSRTHKTTPYLICGDWRHAKVNVCLTCPTQNNILLLVQEDKGLSTRQPVRSSGPNAIAAFAHNNQVREMAGEPTFESKVCFFSVSFDTYNTRSMNVPSVILKGTTPTFYNISVTVDLVRHVRHGTYPAEPSVDTMHVLVVSRPLRWCSEA